MKTRGLFLSALLMGAVMAGCANEEVMNEEFQKPDGNEYYMAVNFFTSESGSRAEGDFAAADDDETKVTNAVFYFLDAQGNSCAEPYKHGALELSSSTHHAGDDKQATPIIVLKNPTATPSSIVVLLNVAADFEYEAYDSLKDLQAIADDYVDNANGFVMSNSVYANANGDVVIGAPVTAANIYKTRDDLEVGIKNSEAVAVPVHVERVLAKVEIENKIGTNISNNEIKLTDENGDEELVALDVTINGWWLNNALNQSLILKDLDPSRFKAEQTWWNDATNLRSYWAESYEDAEYLHYAWENNVKTALYCHENTSAEPTSIVVAATLGIEGKPTTLVRWRNTYYTEDGFKVAFLNNFQSSYKYWYEKDGAYETIDVEHLDFAFNTNEVNGIVTEKDYEAIVTLKADAPTLYTYDGTTATPVEKSEVEGKLKGFATVKLWNGGKTYFFFPIKHLDASGANAVVRNHVYKTNLTAVSGLGTPVPNPERIIFPTPVEDDELSYIAASVYVLKWKVVENNVELK